MTSRNVQEIDNSTTIGSIVAEDIRKADVFKEFNIDFCCGGKKSIDEACKENNIDSSAVIEALQKMDNYEVKPEEDYNSWELDALVGHILNVHHSYVSQALPILDEYAAKVAEVHGDSHPEVLEIYNYYRAVAQELRMHMHKEEEILFPYINQIAIAKRTGQHLASSPFGTVRGPINMMESEHVSAGNALDAIKKLSNNYTPPEDACNTFRALYSKLNEFESDLHRHIHLESNILFPKAIKIEEELMS